MSNMRFCVYGFKRNERTRKCGSDRRRDVRNVFAVASKTVAFGLIGADTPMSAHDPSAFLSAHSQTYPTIEPKDSDEDKNKSRQLPACFDLYRLAAERSGAFSLSRGIQHYLNISFMICSSVHPSRSIMS